MRYKSGNIRPSLSDQRMPFQELLSDDSWIGVPVRLEGCTGRVYKRGDVLCSVDRARRKIYVRTGIYIVRKLFKEHMI